MSARVLITGAASGIGLALVKQYLALGYSVLACARRSSPALLETAAEVIDGVDVTDPAAILSMLEQLDGRSIDILINCAGLLSNESLDDMNYARIQSQWEINALGPLRITEAVLPLLEAGSKIAMITSRMGSIADNTSGSRYGYRMSKAALNAVSKSLAEDLKSQSFAVAIIHPGLVSTKMIGYQGDVSPEQAASRIIARIDDLNGDNSGTFWHANGDTLPW